MSTSTPDGTKPDTRKAGARPEDMNALMPIDYADAAEWMARPLAGAAALSALGLGMASQAVGIWFGMVAGSIDASRRLLDTQASGRAPRLEDGPDFAAQRRSAVDSARATVDALMQTTGATRAAAPVAAKPALRVVASSMAKPAATPARKAAALAPEAATRARPAALERPAAPDDLKAIAGIGPKLEQVLNGLGIWTFGQIANWTPSEAGWIDDHLAFNGRVGRDGWTEQARTLAGRGA